MESEEKLVIFDKYPNELDANIIKGAIEASGIHAGVLGDSTANAIWMAPVSVVVFKRDLKAAIQAVYQGEKNYEDYQEEMDPSQGCPHGRRPQDIDRHQCPDSRKRWRGATRGV